MKKLFVVFLLFVSFVVNAKLGGQALIDSLLKELNSDSYRDKEDTNKARLNRKVAALYEYTDPVEGIKYLQQSREIAEKLGWKKGIADADDLLGSYSMNKSDFPAALDYYFKSLKINEERGDKDRICRNIGNIGTVYMAQSDYPKAREYFLKALKMSEEMGDKDGIAANTANIGEAYYNQKTLTRQFPMISKH